MNSPVPADDLSPHSGRRWAVWGGLFVVAIAVLLFALRPVLFPKPTPSIADLQQRAQAYYDARKYRAASITLKNLLRREPDQAGARALLGHAQLALGDSAAARKEIERAIQLSQDGDAPELYQALVGTLLQLGEYHGAIELIESRRDKGTAAWLNLRGEALLGLKDVTEAERCFRRAMALEPDNQQAALGLILIEHQSGKSDQAMADLQSLLVENTIDPKLLMMKGEMELSQNLYWDAQATFEQALTLPVTQAGVLVGLVRALLGTGDLLAADQHLQQVAQEIPGSPAVLYLQGLIARQRGDLDIARQSVREALSLAPKHVPSLLLMAEIQYRTGHFATAQQVLERVLNQHPSHVEARKLLARVHVALGTPSLALEVLRGDGSIGTDDSEYEQMLDLLEKKLRPGSGSARTTDLNRPAEARVQALLQQGLHDQAIVVAREALDRNAERPDLHVLIGQAYRGKHDQARAREHFHRALNIDTDNFAALHSLARLDTETGRHYDAQQRYAALLKLDPQNPVLQMELADLERTTGHAELAIRRLSQMNETNSGSETVLTLAAMYLKSGAVEKANEVLADAAVAMSGEPSYQLLLGKAQLQADRFEDAVNTLAPLARDTPESAGLQMLMAEAYLHLNRPARAQYYTKLALQQEPHHGEALLQLGRLHITSRQPEQALLLADRFRQQHGDAAAVNLLEGDAWFLLKKWPAAIDRYRAALQQAPTDSGVVLRLSAALQQAEERDAAIALLEGQANNHGGDSRIQMALAAALIAADRDPEAEEIYAAILAHHPDNALALNNIAWVRYRQAKTGAVKTAALAHTMEPNNPDFADTYAWLLVQDGEIHRGLEILDNASQAHPDHLTLAYHHASSLLKVGKPKAARAKLAALLARGEVFQERDAAQRLLAEFDAKQVSMAVPAALTEDGTAPSKITATAKGVAIAQTAASAAALKRTMQTEPTPAFQVSNAVVTTDGLRLRDAPATGSQTLQLLAIGSHLRISKTKGVWLAVRTGSGASGWVHRDHVRDKVVESSPGTGTKSEAPVAGAGGKQVMTTTLRLRDKPESSSRTISLLPQGTWLAVLAEKGDWVRVKSPTGKRGWVHGDYLGDAPDPATSLDLPGASALLLPSTSP